MNCSTFTDHDSSTVIRPVNPKDMLDAFHRIQRAEKAAIDKAEGK